MSRRVQFALYVVLSLVDFLATVFLVNHGYADEANPLIRGFATQFSSFPVGLAIYKVGVIAMLVLLLRIVNRHDPRSARKLLVFANTLMFALALWHLHCLRTSAGLG